MFESSTNVTTSVAIYPNSGDDWDILSPFPAEILKKVVIVTGIFSTTPSKGDTCTDIDTNSFTYLRIVTGTNKHVFEANDSIAPTLQTGNLTNISPGWVFTFTAHDGLENEKGFVFSNSLINNYGLLHLLPKRLNDVGRINNEVNFLAKTNLQSKTIPVSQGIGGMSKLKDFNFTITKDYLGTNPMDINDIINTYGRTISLFISESTGIEDPDNVTYSKIKFKGKIFKAGRKNNEIIFIVKGLLNSANPLVGGAVVTQSDNSQENEAILFGDSGGAYIPISKKEDDNGIVTLQFNQDDKFIIKSLHVKSGTDSEPVWLDIDTPYNIVDNKIIFNEIEYSEIFLREVLDAPINQIDRLVIESYYIVGINFEGDMTPITLSPGDKVMCKYINPSYNLQDTLNRMTYIKMETVLDEDIYFFKCGWEFVFGYLRGHIDNYTNDITDRKTYLNLPHAGGLTVRAISYIVTYRLNPLEKEIDALPIRFPDGVDVNWQAQELKDVLQMWGTADRVFQSIPKDPLIIQIEDEKMLVIYTEKDTGYPSSEQCPDQPEYCYVWVVRGWSNTDKVSHSNNLPVTIYNSLEQKILVNFVRPLQNLNSVTPSGDWTFGTDFDKFLKNVQDMQVWNFAGGGVLTSEHDPLAWLALDFNLPDLTGDLENLWLIGKASVDIDPYDINQGNPEGDAFISIALNTIEEGNETSTIEQRQKRRRIYGQYLHDDISEQDKYKIASYRYDGSLEQVQGEYIFSLKTVTAFARYHNAYIPGAGYSVKQQTNAYNISDYDDLKETSIFFCLNSNTYENKKTMFTFNRPSLKVQLKMDILSADIYAKVIPKKIFDNSSDEFTIGTNGKICWHPYNYFQTIGDLINPDLKNMISVSDDDNLGFTNIAVFSNAKFGFVTPNPNTDYPGFLVKDLIRKNGVGKIYPTQNLKEDYILPSIDVGNYVRTTGFPDGLSDAGKILLENGSSYLWVDQDNNKVKIVTKVILDESNPVSIIQELLTTYFNDVTLNTSSFTVATEKRLSWDARLMVTEEKTLVSLIDMLAKEHGLIVYENNEGEVTIVTLDPPVTNSVSSNIDDTLLIYKDENKESLLDFKEDFTDLNYLITELDVYYDFVNSKYQGYIKSLDLNNQDDFAISKQFTDNDIKIKLQLQTIFNKGTVNKSAEIKMIYHQVPTRIIKGKTTLGASDYDIGGWVTCSSSKIAEVSGKIYLVLSKKEQVPFPGKRNNIEFGLFEFDWDNLVLRIQEVPHQTEIDNYDEVIDTIDDIDEVPNA